MYTKYTSQKHMIYLVLELFFYKMPTFVVIENNFVMLLMTLEE
jgi:hypothetical protein